MADYNWKLAIQPLKVPLEVVRVRTWNYQEKQDFLKDEGRAGQWAAESADEVWGVSYSRFFITDPDVAFEFKMRFA